ncbi:MAG: hypothetical protein AAGB05_18310 [Pseudomonadota bacterium]
MAKKKSPAELKEEGAAISAQITLARKRSINFALQIGKEALVLETDIKKNCDVLWRNAKKNGGGPKGAMGTMSVKGKVIELHCVDDSAPNQLPKLAKKWLAERGLPYKVLMITPSGSIGDEEEGEEEEVDTSGLKRNMTEPEQSQGVSVPGSDLMEEGEEELQTRPSPDSVAEIATPSGGDDDGPAGPLMDQPIKVGRTPAKKDLSGEFGQVRKELLKAMSQLDGPARAAVQEQIAQFGEKMKGNDLDGAQRLMDDLAVAQGTVTESQRGRARDDVGQMSDMVSALEAELDAMETALQSTQSSLEEVARNFGQ